jgi:hypothetical protein
MLKTRLDIDMFICFVSLSLILDLQKEYFIYDIFQFVCMLSIRSNAICTERRQFHQDSIHSFNTGKLTLPFLAKIIVVHNFDDGAVCYLTVTCSTPAHL